MERFNTPLTKEAAKSLLALDLEDKVITSYEKLDEWYTAWRPVLCVIFRRKGQYGAFISGCKVSIVVPHTSVAAESCVCQHRP